MCLARIITELISAAYFTPSCLDVSKIIRQEAVREVCALQRETLHACISVVCRPLLPSELPTWFH